MRTVNKDTKAGELVYPITFQVFDDLPEALANCKENEDTLTAIINAAQEQGAKQGNKQRVREAIEKFGLDSAEVAEAVEAHQKWAAGYTIGAPRGSGGRAITKTKARELGARLHELMSDEELMALAAERGVDL